MGFRFVPVSMTFNDRKAASG